MSYNLNDLQAVLFQWAETGITESIDPQANNITMNAGGTEMLRVAKDGFYVRGKKIEQDDKEAERVYNAFKSFLMWAELNRT